jgi:signal transduction histidine kinase
MFISYRYIYGPLILKHKKEKENIELKNAKLLALFTELDPNPIIRVDDAGRIVSSNKSALEFFKLDNERELNIKDIINSTEINFSELITNNKSTVISQNLYGRFYEINIHGISPLDSAQLYFYDLTEKNDYKTQMGIYQKLLKDSSAHLNSVIEEQRNRFAGLLHDSIGQNLLLTKLSLHNAKKAYADLSKEDHFNDTFELLDSTISEVKEIARTIKPLNLDELGLVTVITSMCKNVSRESGIISYLELPDFNPRLSKELNTCIYRVIQEALNNIIQHSKAREFNVSLTIDEEFVSLITSDDGIGFTPKVLLNEKYISDGMGLLSMQERIERLEGTFHIDSSHNNGTVITVEFPISKTNHEKEHNYKTSRSG